MDKYMIADNTDRTHLIAVGAYTSIKTFLNDASTECKTSIKLLRT